MAIIKEDYVSFETAKLLKEKGFNEPCYTCYLNKEVSHYDYPSTNFELIDDVISAPTLQMAMKWLREVHNIHIEIRCIKNNAEAFVMTIEELPRCLCRGISSNKYEETCEAAIKYCLENLI